MTRFSALRFLRGTPGRFLPGVAVMLCFVAVMYHRGIGFHALVIFLAYQAFGYALPGLLAWRVVRGGRDPAVVDLVLGTIAFHALSVPWYIAVRWAGIPRAVWVLPVATVVVALAMGRRRGLRLTSLWRLPPWCAWNAAAAISLGIVLIGSSIAVATGPLARWPGNDSPYLLSLAGELKYHMPGVIPFVTGQPLDYHWYTFADIASFSWLSGQELDILTIALMPIGLLALGLAGFGVLGWKFTGTPAGGVVALWLAVLVGSVNPLGGFGGSVVDGTFLEVLWRVSPTQGYAQVVSIVVLYVAVEMLRSRRAPGLPAWVLFVLASFVVAGAKATFIPVLGAGAMVALVVAFSRRREWRVVLGMGLVLAAEFVFAQVVLFGGTSQGMVLSPRSSMERIGGTMGLGEGRGVGLVVFVFLVTGWLLPLVLLVSSLFRAERLRVRADLASWWVAGMVVSSMVAAVMLTHPGYSQYSFLRAGLPFATLAVAAVLVRLWAQGTATQRSAAVVVGLLGLGACYLLRSWSEQGAAPRDLTDLVKVVAVSTALTLAVAAATAAIVRPGGRKVAAVFMAGSFTLGMGSARTFDILRGVNVRRPDISSLGPAVIPKGGIEAARYVRGHSDPSDLFATNAHCRLPRSRVCVTTAHWMSAWAERRAVIEGWGYTATANLTGDSISEVTTTPYWDPALLALNDAVFLRPSKASLDALLARFPVRWLMVDTRFPVDLPGLERLLPDHRRFAQTVVLEVQSAR
ncbi:MAG: hypothetical protein JWQ32_1522 [Marmoricola sp.]|nr:hypothetical protein [Marmoricola sp.]